MSGSDSGQQQELASLQGLRVGISGAVPERECWGNVGDLDQIILRFVSQLSALVMKYGGEVVHGSHPSFTPILTRQAQRFGSRDGNNQLTLIASELFGKPPAVVAESLHAAKVILTQRIGDGPESDLQTRNGSLTALRLTLAREIDVLVAIGGKLHQSTGYNPGVLEELTVARWREVPCFIVASHGGLAGQLEDGVVRQFSAGNRMDPAESTAMAIWSDDVDAYVGRLVKHLVIHHKEFIRAQTTYDWFEWARVRLLSMWQSQPVYEIRSIDTNEIQHSAKRFAAVRKACEVGNMYELDQLLNPPTRKRSLADC